MTKIQEVIESYKEFKGFGVIPKWDKNHYPKNVPAAKALLESAGDDPKLAIFAIQKIGKNLNGFGEQYKNWSLWAIVKHFPNWFVNEYKKTNNESAFYDGGK